MSLYVGTSANSYEPITRSFTDYELKQIAKKYFAPQIGDVKLLAVANPPSINIASSSFDGWVVANGQTIYSSGRFPEAAKAYAGDRNATTFAVPDIQKFFKAKNGNGNYAINNATAPLQKHYHPIDTSITYSSESTDDYVITAMLSVCITTGTNSPTKYYDISKDSVLDVSKTNYAGLWGNANIMPALHGAGANTDTDDHQMAVDLIINSHVSFDQILCDNTGKNASSFDNHPAYTTLIPLVFIGFPQT